MSNKDTVPWWHIFHRWSRWERGEAEVASIFPKLSGPIVVQIRTCVRCGKQQIGRMS